MTQTSFLHPPPPRPAQHLVADQVTAQRRDAARVLPRLRDVIEAWCARRLANGGMFHLGDLVAAVVRIRGTGSNASSVDRVLRILRAEGVLNYRVLDRSRSLYEILPVTR
jgi:hypothetical protein